MTHCELDPTSADERYSTGSHGRKSACEEVHPVVPEHDGEMRVPLTASFLSARAHASVRQDKATGCGPFLDGDSHKSYDRAPKSHLHRHPTMTSVWINSYQDKKAPSR